MIVALIDESQEGSLLPAPKKEEDNECVFFQDTRLCPGKTGHAITLPHFPPHGVDLSAHPPDGRHPKCKGGLSFLTSHDACFALHCTPLQSPLFVVHWPRLAPAPPKGLQLPFPALEGGVGGLSIFRSFLILIFLAWGKEMLASPSWGCSQ